MPDDLNYDSFYSQLYAEIPEFASFDLTDDASDGEVLMYVLMGDFKRFVYATCQEYLANMQDQQSSKRVLEASSDLMERAINSPDDKLVALIWLGFVESLTPDSEDELAAYQYIKAQLGPKLHYVLVTHFDEDDWYANKQWD